MKQLFRHSLLALMILLLLAEFSIAAGNASVDISAVVLSKSICRFVTKTATLSFGNLDPSKPVAVTSSTDLTFRCQGSSNPATYMVNFDDGLHASGPGTPRLQHTMNPTAYIPYNISISPVSGSTPKNVISTLIIDGIITGTDYQTAIAGNYIDTITVNIVP